VHTSSIDVGRYVESVHAAYVSTSTTSSNIYTFHRTQNKQFKSEFYSVIQS